MNPVRAMAAGLADFTYGMSLPFRALKLVLTDRRLLALWIAPALLTLAASSWLVSGMKGLVQGWLMHALAQQTLVSASFSISLAHWISLLVALLVGLALFSLIAGIVIAPFGDFISERTEKVSQLAYAAMPAGSDSARFKLKALALDLSKTGFAAVAQIAVLLGGLILVWIPGFFVVPMAGTALLLAFQFVSYAQTRRGLGLRAGLSFLVARFPSSLGFGLALMVVFSIPLVSSLFIPLAVVGGTLLVGRSGMAT